MRCVVYKGVRKPDTVLFVEREDDFSRVPDSLLQLLGRLQQVTVIELAPGRVLAQADAGEVRRLLRSQGYYLQLPPGGDRWRAPLTNTNRGRK